MSTTTAEPITALATREMRELSDEQLKRRLQLSRGAGYGLQQASPAQLEVIFLLCRRYKLDPLTDLTLYEGRPWITIDGRVRLMRRHPEYRGYGCRPLSRSEKEEWGYEADDIVVECTVRTTTWGDISARGKVSRAEFEGRQGRANPVAKVHPVEMAEKRAIARAERAAFGQDAVIDEEEAEIEIIEQEARNTPERRAALAARYQEIWPADDEAPINGNGDHVEHESQAAPNDALERNAELLTEAEELGVNGLRKFKASADWPADKIDQANMELSERIKSRNVDLDAQAARQSGQPMI